MDTDSDLSRFHTNRQPPWFAILSPARKALAALTVAAVIFLGGGVLDWLVVRQHLPRISLMLGGVAVSFAIGLLVFRILSDIQTRYQELLDRLKRIAGLNHHIRNALQVIAYNSALSETGPAIKPVTVQIARIESVLSEVSKALGEH
jgi:hypothetical protein